MTEKKFFKGDDFLISLETAGIFSGAFLLTSGGDPAAIRVRNNGRRIATFLIPGKAREQGLRVPRNEAYYCTPQ